MEQGTHAETQDHDKAAIQEHMQLFLHSTTSSAVGQSETPTKLLLTQPNTKQDSLACRKRSSTDAFSLQAEVEPDGSTESKEANDVLVVLSELMSEIREVKLDSEKRQRSIDDLTVSMDAQKKENKQIIIELASTRRELAASIAKASSFEQRLIVSLGKAAAMEHRILSMEKSVAMKDTTLADHDVRLLSLEMASYDGILRWKLTQFSRLRQEAVAGKRLSLYSPPFFTSRTGYKMCARVYPNGDGMGKGSHLSLFFVLMKGEYDSLLPWPFQQRVTFTLVDQNHQRHISDTFHPDAASSSFQRPSVGDMNVASGCPLFAPLEALQARGYVKDDVMFIRVAVDTRGLVHP